MRRRDLLAALEAARAERDKTQRQLLLVSLRLQQAQRDMRLLALMSRDPELAEQFMADVRSIRDLGEVA